MSDKPKDQSNPFRRAVLRGLGIVLPPLLTVILFVWAFSILDQRVLQPVEHLVRVIMVWQTADIHEEPPTDATSFLVQSRDGREVNAFALDGITYVQLPQGRYIPQDVYNKVNQDPGDVPLVSADAYYDRYIRVHWLKRRVVVPVFFCVFILVLYILGKFFAAGMGRMMWNGIESLIKRLPLISNVYSSVKQVTDFMFSESEIEFNRVVAVEYPRKGIWSIGFVTGESMLDIRAAANEPVLSVLMPTSPMPATGFTVTVLKSETIDLDLSIDQALQFVVSCGVVVPLQQQQASSEISSRIAAAISDRSAKTVDSEPPPRIEHTPINGSETKDGQAESTPGEPGNGTAESKPRSDTRSTEATDDGGQDG